MCSSVIDQKKKYKFVQKYITFRNSLAILFTVVYCLFSPPDNWDALAMTELEIGMANVGSMRIDLSRDSVVFDPCS